MRNPIKFFRQYDKMDCGPTCLKMIAYYYGKEYSIDLLRSFSGITKKGVTLFGLKNAAARIGLDASGVLITIDQINNGSLQLPCIIHWKEQHFVVLFKIKKNLLNKLLRRNEVHYLIADPGHGITLVDATEFKSSWLGDKLKGVALMIKTGAHFENITITDIPSNSVSIKLLLSYLKPYHKYILRVAFGMLISSLLFLLLPFLTQGLVDIGIKNNNPNFILLILFSQLIIFVGSLTIDIIRNWILIHVNTRISVNIISEFLNKLMKLPISFFDSKNTGDITQRINDHSRVESFLTGSALSSLFSFLNLLVFSIVLGIYNLEILIIFIVGSVFSVSWSIHFLSKRKDLDYLRFQHLRDNQTAIYEVVDGINEIKLNNWEHAKRKNWEHIQSKLFTVTSKNLALEQTQEAGSNSLLQLKNVLISYISAISVIHGVLSLGQMLSISFIIGQMNTPLNQLVSFIRGIQDAKISFERLTEIQILSNEDDLNPICDEDILSTNASGISLINVSFSYGSLASIEVLSQVNLFIPEGKTTAIVGSSGSGKTTLLKLLLRFYEPTCGIIAVNDQKLSSIKPSIWRNSCGTVMQDGYIFSDTILRNIVLETDNKDIDESRLQHALDIANINDYVKKLPLGLASHIGNSGMGLSGGQKQRILIARAAYKNPKYLFFDEATSSLDSGNEKIIMNNFHELFEGKTVLIIAHRLSTIRDADQIVVMDDGKIVEIGNHEFLLAKRGKYHALVQNQLHSEILYK